MIPKVVQPAAKHYSVVRPPAKQYKDVTPGRSMAAAPGARRPVSLPVLRQPGPTGASDCRCASGGACSCPGKGSGQCGCTAKAGCPCRSRRDPLETAVPLHGRIGPGPRDQPRWLRPPVPRRPRPDLPSLTEPTPLVTPPPPPWEDPATPRISCRGVVVAPGTSLCRMGCGIGQVCCQAFPPYCFDPSGGANWSICERAFVNSVCTRSPNPTQCASGATIDGAGVVYPHTLVDCRFAARR